MILVRLGPDLAATAEAAITLDPGAAHPPAPALDVAALAHGRREARLFATYRNVHRKPRSAGEESAWRCSSDQLRKSRT